MAPLATARNPDIARAWRAHARRPGFIRTLIVLWLLGIPALGLPAQSRSDAPLYLDQAIAQYRQGNAERAEDYLLAARALDPDLPRTRPEIHKLTGLLWLAAGRQREAMSELLAYLQVHPDAPLLWYLLADFNLKHRNYGQAARAYGQAARFAYARRQAGQEPAPDFLRTLAPALCPAEPANFHWDGLLADPLRDPALWDRFWDRGLSSGELALATYEARVLPRTRRSSYISAPDRRPSTAASAVEENDLEQIWKFALQYASDELDPGLVALLRSAPEVDGPHQKCLQALEALEREQLQRIARGESEPARSRLELVRRYLERLHFDRMALRGDLRSSYRYGSYLLRRGMRLRGWPLRAQAIQSLHALRHAFALSATGETESGSLLRYDDSRQLFVQVQILRQLARAYELLTRPADQRTITQIADTLEDYVQRLVSSGNAQDPSNAARRKAVQAELRKRCGENPKNREGLLILIADARERARIDGADSGRVRYWRRKLAERDREFDEAELLSAFGS